MRGRLPGALLALCGALAAGTAGFFADRSFGTSAQLAAEVYATVEPGYRLELVADQLTAPVGVAADSKREIYVAESGAGTGTPPRLLRLGPGQSRSTVADDFPAPLTGLTWYDQRLFISYAGGVDVMDQGSGIHYPILGELPALGDHTNGPIVFDRTGTIYFGLGAATNAGVIGLDNIGRGWVERTPNFHDIPCKPVILRGINFTVANPLTEEPRDMVTTGAFAPFGKTTARLQRMEGTLPCTGAVLSARMIHDPGKRTNSNASPLSMAKDGTDLALVAWGLRDPSYLAFGPNGGLYATVPGYADRGSRPVVNDNDYLYRINPDRWYGWPDFAGGRSLTEEDFQKGSLHLSPLLTDYPEQPPSPVAIFPSDSGVRGLLFPPEPFGLRGDALIALFGSTTPEGTAKESAPLPQIVRVNPRTGQIRPFVRPTASQSDNGQGLQRPLALTAAPDGSVLLVDYGQVRLTEAGPEPIPGTGSVWRLVRLPSHGGAH